MWRNRTLVFAGITALSIGLSGCVISDNDDQAFIFDWGLQYVGGGGVGCDDAGTPTVTLEAEHVQTRVKHTKNFTCGSGRGETEVLPLGSYVVTIILKDRGGRPVSSISGGSADIHRHGLTDLGTVLFQIQTWQLSWAISKNVGGRMEIANCAQVGGEKVQLITQIGNEDKEMFTFACADGAGITQAIRTGSYGVQVRLLGAGGTVLSDTGVRNFPVGGDKPAAISVTFDVN